MTALEILIAARDWLAVGPERWCQWADCLNRHGRPTYNGAYVRQASALGAITMASELDFAAKAKAAMRLQDIVQHGSSIVSWNDSLPPGRAGWERVVEAFDRAIEAEKARSDG